MIGVWTNYFGAEIKSEEIIQDSCLDTILESKIK